MIARIKELNRALRDYDQCLYAQETCAGRIDIYRKNREALLPPHFVFCLTDDWTPRTRPVPWGIEVVMNRLKAHDLWRDDTFVEQWIKTEEKRVESKERDFKNSVESFFYDFRRQFQKATDGFNTSTIEKTYRKGL